MPINQNHLFEDLNGIKCSIVEKNATKERVDFLRSILELNHFEVIVLPSPPPKVAPGPATTQTSTEQTFPPANPPVQETFTIGVTDVMFNPINAIFGRLLKTRDGRTITLAYWQQKEEESRDDVPYFNNK